MSGGVRIRTTLLHIKRISSERLVKTRRFITIVRRLLLIRVGWMTEVTMCRTRVVYNACRQNSCQNGATCVNDDTADSYTCECPAEYTGRSTAVTAE